MGRGGCILCSVRSHCRSNGCAARSGGRLHKLWRSRRNSGHPSRYFRVLHLNRSDGLCGRHHRLGLLVLGGDLLQGDLQLVLRELLLG